MNSREVLDYLLEGNTFSPNQLDDLIRDQPKEDQYLDYKDGRLTTSKKRKGGRETIRHWTNGFANSDGGLLVVGVSEEQPRTISACDPTIANEPLDKWAEGLLHDMTPYMSPLPRIQVVCHPQGPVLLIAVARAPQLVPCVEARQLKYFLRLNQSTLEAPPYLLSDLVLGRRQHPLLDVRLKGIEWQGDQYAPSELRAMCTFTIENMSLVDANNVRLGIISWSSTRKRDRGSTYINRYLRSHINEGQSPDRYPTDKNIVR